MMRQFMEQVSSDTCGKKYIARCPECGAQKELTLWLARLLPAKRRLQTAALRLVRYFNRCPLCGRWVCDACFDLSDGYGACRRCAKDASAK